MPQQTLAQHAAAHTHDELILVVKRSTLFPADAWHGICPDRDNSFFNLITQHQEFQPRSIMEQDPAYKQIIPYLIFKHENRYFVMQRHAKASEQRLQGKITLGIGGHIRKEDMTSNSLFDWARREFHEEVSYAGNLKITPLGIINDDSNDVGKVHLGFVLLLEGDSANIGVKSELQSGELMTLDECQALKSRMESWSVIALAVLA